MSLLMELVMPIALVLQRCRTYGAQILLRLRYCWNGGDESKIILRRYRGSQENSAESRLSPDPLAFFLQMIEAQLAPESRPSNTRSRPLFKLHRPKARRVSHRFTEVEIISGERDRTR